MNNARIAVGLCGLLMVLGAGCPNRGTGGAAGKAAPSGSAPGGNEGGNEGGKKGTAEARKGEVVAKVGNASITVGDVEAAINEQSPFVRRRYTSLEQRKKLLENMVQFEVLTQEAARRKLDQDPEVVRKVKAAMIGNGLMMQLRGELVKLAADITDADIQAYFDNNKQLYQRPAQVRVSVVVTPTEKEAAQVLAEARKAKASTQLFAELVKLHSIDAASRSWGGDLDFFSKNNKELPAPLVKAAFDIQGMWKLAGPVKTDKGWVVMMKTGEREAVSRSLDAERAEIRNRLFNERRRAALEAYVTGCARRPRSPSTRAALAKVKVQARPAPPPAHGHTHPGPGGM